MARRVCDRRTPLSRPCTVLDERWNSLLECTSDLVVVVDGHGLISHVNHMPARLAGSREGVVGRSIYDFLAPEYRVSVREAIERVFQTGETIRQVVCFCANGSGALCSEACIGPITQNGQTVAAGMFFTDITEREKLQTRLRESQMLLSSIVRAVPKMMDILEGLICHGTNVGEPGRRAQELELCREQMVQIGRLASIGKASSSLTQRLPQFLTAIGMSIENALAKLDVAAIRDGVGRELEAALGAVSALAAGVEQVRNFAATGSRQPVVHAVDMGAILVGVVQLLEARARGVNTVICLDHLDELPKVRMAEGDAEQLFFSLIENLMRFTDGKKHHRITVSGVVNDRDVELRFSDDDGLGEKETSGVSLDRLFTVEPIAKAVDLGLCVAWDIVIQAGGAICHESTAGVGSTFFVNLPMADRVRSQWGQSGRKRKTTCFRR